MTNSTFSSESNNRVVMQNPNTGRNDKTIAREIYEPVREAILAAISESDGVLALSELRHEVEQRTTAKIWEHASIGWYTTTVKLDLEAKGLIVKEGSPQMLRLASK